MGAREKGWVVILEQASLLLGTERAGQAMPGPASENKACPGVNEGGVKVSGWL